jgi:hypothetical protein
VVDWCETFLVESFREVFRIEKNSWKTPWLG